MATSPWSQTALLTVATEGFVPGTFVTLGTFLERHPDFDGDIVVVAEELSDLSRDVLAGLYPRLRFEPPSPQLAARVAKLCEARPELSPRLTAFYSLEAFRPRRYRKLLALDSDLLFRGSVTPLLDVEGELVCCRDQFALRGVRRDATTYQPAEDDPSSEGCATIGDTFNCGVFLLRGSLMSQGVYDELVRMVAPATWRGVKAVNTDQLVLNRYFAGRQTLASSAYNYFVTSAAAIRAREGIAVNAAAVLHFKLPIKPWQAQAMLRWARPSPSHLLPPGFKAWYDAYLRCLAAANLRRRTRHRQPLVRVAKAGASATRAARPAPLRSPAPHGRICLAVATSESLVPATLVTLDSFLMHHPRFAGDIVVIDDDLSDASRQALAGVGPVRFEPVSNELRERLAQLGRDVPRLRHKLAHFHSIGAFRLTGYRKLVVCDSDLLFRAPIDELFATGDALIACPDSPTLRGLARDAKTFRTVAAASADVLQDTFNSGLVVVDGSELPAAYHSLLAMLKAETWRETEVALTDQLLLNRHFAGRQRLASSAYNYLIAYAAHIRAREGIGIGDAKVLHYLAPYKPWQSQRMLRWAASGSTRGLLPGYQLWYDAYVDCLARLGMRTAARGAARRAVGAPK